MKLDRSIGILSILLQKDRVTAKELAEKFDTSVRTIYRDIDAINLAGIPIVTYQGNQGGIGIVDGYKLDKSLLTNNELASIVTALKSVSTSSLDKNTDILLNKLKHVVPSSHLEAFNNKTQEFMVDFTPWGSENRLKDTIQVLRSAIGSSLVVEFIYGNMKGQVESRVVEPHTIILKGQKWYLYAYCRNRKDFRLFKISRIKHLSLLGDETFNRRDIDLTALPWDKEWGKPQNQVRVTLKFHKSVRHMVEEWFGEDSLKREADDSLRVETSLPDGPWLYGYVLSYGPWVEVLEPLELRQKIKELAEKTLKLYKK